MEIDEFWSLIERSAQEADGPKQRLRWLQGELSRLSPAHIVDFQVHLNAARRPLDTHAMWGAARQIQYGACSDDGFWYFQPWLIGQGRHWYEHAAAASDNLADVPAVQALARRPREEWGNADWPQWEELDYVARHVLHRLTGREESLFDALAERGEPLQVHPQPSDPSWDIDDPDEVQRRLPRLTELFSRW